MNEETKKILPWAAGGLIGLYLVVRFMGHSSAPVDNTGAYLAAQANASNRAQQINAQLSAQQSQTSVAMAQIDAAASVNQTMANANLAAATGQSVAQIIQAQSMLPAMAINAAMNNNQTTLTQSAQTAIAGFNALPKAMDAQANQIVAASQQFNTYMNAAGQTQSNFSASMPLLVNAVGSSAAAGTTAVAGQAGRVAAANANSSGAMWSTIGTVAMVAAGA